MIELKKGNVLGFILVSLFILTISWIVENAPYRVEAEKYLSTHKSIIEKVGMVKDFDLDKITNVQGAVKYSGERTEAYSLYNYYITGTNGELFVRVKISNLHTDSELLISIKDIEQL